MLAALPVEERARSVVLVQDAFTSWYEPHVVFAVLDLMQAIGFSPFIAPFRPNGKPLHVHGFLGAFTRAASRNATMLRDLAATGVELVGVDTSMTLTYRSEYGMLPDADRPPPVLLLQEWLARRCDAIPNASSPAANILLLPHCSERSLALSSLRDWQAAFAAAGASLRVLPSGCCGMAGTYGHEAEHRATSEQIYGMSWGPHVAEWAAERPLARDRLFLPIAGQDHRWAAPAPSRQRRCWPACAAAELSRRARTSAGPAFRARHAAASRYGFR